MMFLEICCVSFPPPFGMYELLALTSSEHAGVENGELRAERGYNGHATIFIPIERAAQLEEGVCGTADLEGNFMSTRKAAISGHFSQPGYSIVRHTEFREDMRKDGNRVVNEAMVVSLEKLSCQCVSVTQHQQIEDSPCGELI